MVLSILKLKSNRISPWSEGRLLLTSLCTILFDIGGERRIMSGAVSEMLETLVGMTLIFTSISGDFNKC